MSNQIERASAVAFEGVTPIVRVRNLAASLDYYVHKLGFKIDWQAPIFASVSRGRCHIFLSEGDQGNPGGWVCRSASRTQIVIRGIPWQRSQDSAPTD